MLPTVFETAFKAGERLKKKSKNLKSLKIDHKKAQGLVSQADIESEKLISKLLLKKFPDHEILGEEESYKKFGSTKKLDQFSNIPWCWVVDPLDGTTNYLNHFNYYAVCIGLLHQGRAVLGVIYRPETGECFYASEGSGAFKGILTKDGITKKRKLVPKNKRKLKDCLLVTGFSSEKGKVFLEEFKKFNSLLTQCRGVRRLGSAALDMCYVADGVFDGFWEAGLAPWDVTAASVICKESRLMVGNYRGEAFDPFDKNIMVANASITKQIQKFLK